LSSDCRAQNVQRRRRRCRRYRSRIPLRGGGGGGGGRLVEQSTRRDLHLAG